MFFRCTQPWQAPTAPLLSGVSCSVPTQGLGNSALSTLIWHGWTGIRRQDGWKTRQSQKTAPWGHSPRGAVCSLPAPPAFTSLTCSLRKSPQVASYLSSFRKNHSILYCFLVAKQEKSFLNPKGKKKYRIKCKFKVCLCYKEKKCVWRILGGNYKISPGCWWYQRASGQNPEAFPETFIQSLTSGLVLSSPFIEKPKCLNDYLWNTNSHSLQLKWRHAAAETMQTILSVTQIVEIGCKLLDIKKHSYSKTPKHFIWAHCHYEKELCLLDNLQTPT